MLHKHMLRTIIIIICVRTLPSSHPPPSSLQHGMVCDRGDNSEFTKNMAQIKYTCMQGKRTVAKWRLGHIVRLISHRTAALIHFTLLLHVALTQPDPRPSQIHFAKRIVRTTINTWKSTNTLTYSQHVRLHKIN